MPEYTHQEVSGVTTDKRPRALRWSFAGRISAVFTCLLVLMAGLAAAVGHVFVSPWLTFVVLLLVGLPLGTWLIGRSMRPLDRILKGLACGISSFRDRDFSVRLAAKRKDELGEIARLYNQVGQTLQEERYDIRQKELLLATALNRSPAAIILVDAQDRVIYANYEARHLLMGGVKLEGRRFVEIREACPPPMREILTNDTDGLFSVRHDDEHIETYHLSQRAVRLNRRRHTLILLHLITGELGRQEAEAWKKVIRVICHELNNSLAPLSSLVHSAKTIADRPGQEERIEEIFDIIHERLAHLGEFIEGYARFARLPRPRKEEVRWQDLLATLVDCAPFSVLGNLPTKPGRFDRSQMQLLLVNLLKNAVEASDGDPDIGLRVQQSADGSTYFQVLDKGRGMDEQTMNKALLPFYSTKQTGSGLGLPLCREIIEAHGGRISIQARQGGGTTVSCWLPA